MENASNELIELLDYAIDKFNIAIEIPREQLQKFAIQFIEKTITYEVLTSALNILIYLAIIIGIVILHKKAIKGSYIKTIINKYLAMENGEVIDLKIAVLIMKVFIIALITCFICNELKDIILCFAFPEKIVLEFIGNYI